MIALRRGSAAGILFFPLLLTAGPQVWFCPLDPIFRPGINLNYSGSPQYLDLFAPNADWAQAASHVNVFKIYPQWIGQAADADLRTQFADLKRRGIALALEYPVLTPSTCGIGVEGFGLDLLGAAQRIQQNGGTLQYVAMDEPTYFSTIYSGSSACHWTIDQMAANAAVKINAMLAQFPGVKIGDIEPFPSSDPTLVPQYRLGVEAFQKLLGAPFAFFDVDLNWNAMGYLANIASARKMAEAEGIPFGVIYNGSDSDITDSQWIQSATNHMAAVELNLGSPDLVIFQSWNAQPQTLLPETDPDSFTSLIDAYFRRRTALVSGIQGNSLAGTLTTTDTGQPVAGAPIDVTVSPMTGAGVPALYTLTGSVPAGTQSVVFGVRVNEECNCAGTADFLVSSFSIDAGGDAGGAGFLVGDFSNQLTGWFASTTGTAKVEGTRLHVVAQSGQSVLLNSTPIPFTTVVPFTFEVSAQVSPSSAGSGYFAVIFLGASTTGTTTEISRVEIPIASGTIPLGSAITDANGQFSMALPATGADSFQIQSAYVGSNANWPAQTSGVSASQKSVSIDAITSAASYSTFAVAPGEIVVLFGSGFGPGVLTPGMYSNGRLNASIGQTTVSFDGMTAPVVYASNTQLAAIVPYGVTGSQTAVTVTGAFGTSVPFIIPVTPSAPSLFTEDSAGSGPLAALNADGTFNTAANPAKRGDPVVLFGTGGGETAPVGVDGAITSGPGVSVLAASVTVGGQAAQVDYFGPAPAQVTGVFQLNATVPLSAPTGAAVPIAVKVGEIATSRIATIAIR